MKSIIDTALVKNLLKQKSVPPQVHVFEVLERAKKLKGLDIEDVALLIRAGSGGFCLNEILRTAGEVKEKCFGKRIVLFAPLYLTNDCINNCLYCGFRRDNSKVERNSISVEEVVREARILEQTGFKRLLLVAGESPRHSGVDRIISVVRALYKNTGIRIVHVNAAPMSVDDLKKLKAAGVGVFQVFQETYHEDTYRRMHPSGPKSDMGKRLLALDKAMEAGFDDVGMGALLGLYDWKFELFSLVSHARHLYEKFGAWPHTISVPRLKPAVGSPVTVPPFPVPDNDFRLIVAICRLAVPTAGVVVTTREPAKLRDELLEIGVSQISAGSRTDPGGYSEKRTHFNASQFHTSDCRSLEEVVDHIARTGNMPSLCTSCYRVGRTGKAFAEKASRGEMGQYCLPNALLTLKEYILDHANGSAGVCDKVIQEKIEEIDDEKLRSATLSKLIEIEKGKRDLFF